MLVNIVVWGYWSSVNVKRGNHLPSLQFNKPVRPSKQASPKGIRAEQNFIVGMLKAICLREV